MTDSTIFVLERVFDAPRELVWRAWTDPTLLARWYGPNVETIVHELSVKPGGVWRNEMKWGNGGQRERMEYLEVIEPEKLVWLHSMTDENWTVSANPMMPDWPRVLLTTVTFKPDGDQTKLRLTWQPYEASQAEIDCFAGAMAGLDQGWGSGMDILAEVLAELQA